MEREAKEKEWAAQEAERSGEWYYKEVRPLFRHSMSDQHPQEGLAMLQSCSHALEAPCSRRCSILYLSKSACSMFLLSRARLVAALEGFAQWLASSKRPVCKQESGCAD